MKLFKHQETALEFIKKNSGLCALWHEMGLGKTRTAIEAYKYFKAIHYQKSPNPLKLLVLAPISLLDAAWKEDLNKFAPELSFANLHSDSLVKNIDLVPDVCAVNFEVFVSKKRLSQLMDLIDQKDIDWMIVIDESSRIKNATAQTTKKLLPLATKFQYRIVMSGTPAPNGETEYWPQIEFIRPGLLSRSFYAFRNTFFHLQKGEHVIQSNGQVFSRQAMKDVFQKGYKYELTDANRQKLMNLIGPYCHFAKKKECLDLPEQIDEVREVSFGAKQRSAYNDMKKHMVSVINREAITAQAALTKMMKLRELTSGFCLDDWGNPQDIGENPKLKELMSVIEDSGDQQSIIWCEFKYDLHKIHNELAKKYGPDSVVGLYSESGLDRGIAIEAFKTGKARFLLAHPKSAAHGLTFVNCSLQIFFSLSFSLEQHEQARARTHRAGQTKNCTYVYLVVKDSIDQDIMTALRKKETAQQTVYRMFKKSLDLFEAAS